MTHAPVIGVRGPCETPSTDLGQPVALYRELFDRFEKEGVGVCLWKGLHEVPEALQGFGDLDLYVRSGSRAALLRSLDACGFVESMSPYRFPYVAHYYGYDGESGRLCHLHCYFKLVTGESHTKQYVLPIERYLGDADHVPRDGRIAELDPPLLARLASLRRQVKLSCLPGLLLCLRDGSGRVSELRAPDEDHRRASVRFATDESRLEAGWTAAVRERSSLLGDALEGSRLRWHLRGFRRYSVPALLMHRYSTILLRAVNKFRGVRKRLSHGAVIAVTGLDGSGKSTAVKMLDEWLGRDLTVRVIHYGRGRVTPITAPLRLALLVRRRSARDPVAFSMIDADGGSRLRGWLPHVRYAALAYERRALLRRALRWAASGDVVIADRWYGLEPGKMDSPRLNPDAVTGLRRRLALLERRLYDLSPDPDLVLRIVVDCEVAVQRNRDRDKPDKESDEEIVERFRVNSGLRYRTSRAVDIDGHAPLASVQRSMKEHVWRLIRGEPAPDSL